MDPRSNRYTPDNRDDFDDDEGAVLAIGHGRLGLAKYSDNDSDDASTDQQMTHARRNASEFDCDNPPDPYSQRHPMSERA